MDGTEDLIPLAQLSKLLPPALRHLHASTAARWALRGVGNPKVKIDTIKIGGRRFVTRAAVDRFVAELTGGGAVRATAAAERRSQSERVERLLDAEGI